MTEPKIKVKMSRTEILCILKGIDENPKTKLYQDVQEGMILNEKREELIGILQEIEKEKEES